MVFIFNLIFSSVLGFCAPTEISTDWQLTREKDGIQVFKGKVSGSDLFAFKGVAEIDGPVARVATVIFDTNRAPEWMVDLEKALVVKWTSPTEFLEYDHFGTPFVMKDRDFLSHVTLSTDPATKEFKFHYESAQDGDAPETRYVRGCLMNSNFKLTPVDGGTKTKVIAEMHVDPKGSVPRWIVNFFQKDWPIDTFNGLRRQVKKSDVQDDPRFVKMIESGDAKFASEDLINKALVPQEFFKKN